MTIFLLVTIMVICLILWWFIIKKPELVKKKLLEEQRLATQLQSEKELEERTKVQSEQELQRRRAAEQIEVERKQVAQQREAEERKVAEAAQKEAIKNAELSVKPAKQVEVREIESRATSQQIEKLHAERVALHEQKRQAAELEKKLKLQEAENRKKQEEADRVKKKLAHEQWLKEDARIKEELALKEQQIIRKQKLELEKAERDAKRKLELAEAVAEAKLLEQKKIEIEKRRQEAKERSRKTTEAQQAALKAATEKKEQSVKIDWHAHSALTLCEENTSYCDSLNKLFGLRQQNFSFDDIRGLSSAQGDHVFYQLQSGVKQLDSPEQLLQYIFAYGKMHKAKLYESYSTFAHSNTLKIDNKQIEVFDYGCGQGIATIILLDYLKACNKVKFGINQIVLIEPSILALKRAALHVRYSLRSVNIDCPVASYQIDLDSISETHIRAHDASIKIHLFSNILDVNGINLSSLQSKILASLTGENYFICISPNINNKGGTHERNQRLHSFYNFFQSSCNAKLISARTTDIDGGAARPWTRFERVFHVDKSNTGADMSNASPVVFYEQDDDEDDLPF